MLSILKGTAPTTEVGNATKDDPGESRPSCMTDEAAVEMNAYTPPRFDVDTPSGRAGLVAYLEEHGYAVVADVFGGTDGDAAVTAECVRSMQWDFLEAVPGTRVDRNDPEVVGTPRAASSPPFSNDDRPPLSPCDRALGDSPAAHAASFHTSDRLFVSRRRHPIASTLFRAQRTGRRRRLAPHFPPAADADDARRRPRHRPGTMRATGCRTRRTALCTASRSARARRSGRSGCGRASSARLRPSGTRTTCSSRSTAVT